MHRRALRSRLLGAIALLSALLSPASPLGAPSVATASTCPGPDAFGYTCLGSSILGPSGDTDRHVNCDDCFATFPLPFPVSFYGEFFTSVTVSSNGVLQFLSSNTAFDNGNLPDARFNYAIFAYFDDLHTGLQTGDGVFTALTGGTSFRRFVIEWRARLRDAPNSVVNFRVRFEEDTSEIIVEYLNIPDGGASATVGIQQGTNSAFLQRSANQPSLSSNSALLFAPPADMSILSIDPRAENSVAGTVWGYQIVAFNRSNVRTANNVMVSIPLPTNTTFDSWNSLGGWSCTTPAIGGTGTVVCTTPTVGPRAAPQFSVFLRVSPSAPQGSEIILTATVTQTGSDPWPSNNTGLLSNTVTTKADVGVLKSDAPDPVVRGSTLTYSVSVFNDGPSDAQTVVLSDPLPAGTTFESVSQVSGPAFGCTTPAVGSGGTITCNRGTLAAGAHATLRFVVRTAASGGASISNTVSVTSTTFDPSSANNSATASTVAQTPTPFPRPNVGVAVAPAPGAGALQTTLTARDANCSPNNQLQSLQFTRLANATVEVATAPVTTVSTAPTTVSLPTLPASIVLTVRRVTAGQPTTVELIVTDGCGTWPTFVGGGASAF
jgi:uncharacterized repeat protein (TIGR01451 family)